MARTVLRDGCPGCDRLWAAKDAEGQCSRCKRCLGCCERKAVLHTCAWRYERMMPAKRARSVRSYERWLQDPEVLIRSRRIT